MTQRESLWAITSFFNPANYRSRRENYRLFRQRLSAPLLTVELSHGGGFALSHSDAEILLQLQGGDVMWQKERLLNVALGRLPEECRYVAWVDCDLVFSRDDWAARTVDRLGEAAIVQPFTRVYHLRRDAMLSPPDPGEASVWKESIASQHQRGALSVACLEGDGPLDFSPGQAWAMGREDIERTGLYDASIIGGGSLLMAAAALGRFREAAGRFKMNPRQESHYLRWARKFYEVVGGRAVALEGDVYHLWHGERRHRGYGVRHSAMRGFAFDPGRDIAVGESGCWRWNTPKEDLHLHMRRFFESRLEDGDGTAPPRHGT